MWREQISGVGTPYPGMRGGTGSLAPGSTITKVERGRGGGIAANLIGSYCTVTVTVFEAAPAAVTTTPAVPAPARLRRSPTLT